jgi:hypothetical protein
VESGLLTLLVDAILAGHKVLILNLPTRPNLWLILTLSMISIGPATSVASESAGEDSLAHSDT